MSKLLHTSHFTSIHRRSFSSITLSSPPSILLTPSLSPLRSKFSLFTPLSNPPQPLFQSLSNSRPRRNLSIRAFDSSSEAKKEQVSAEKEKDPNSSETPGDGGNGSVRSSDDVYPSGEFEFEEFGAWRKFVVKLRMLFAFPWERIRKGSVLNMKLRGQISDQLKSRFSSGLSLPQICENFIKAAYDPRISGIYLHIEPLNCGWGKVEEIRRHMLDFKKSGKFVVGYVPACGEKEYYVASACDELFVPPSAYFALYGLTVQASFLGGVLEKVGVEPQVQRIGKYKSAGDQLARKSMSEENCEMLTTLLDNIYGNWLDEISVTTGKKREDIENFINEGVFQVERLKEDGWITNIKYDDEVMSMLKKRLGLQEDKNLPVVDYRKYSRVRKWTLGLSGGKDQIVIIRASGSISRVRGPFSVSGSGITSEQFIEKICSVREPLSVIDSSVSLNYGRKVRISYKGVPGAYSEDAALKAYSQCETVPYNKFEDAFKAVELWLADKTVLPIENSLGGSIHRKYDLLLRHKLHIVGEVQLAVNLCLLALPGVWTQHLKRVLSHPQALAQSDIILSKLGATRENVNDTTSAAQLVASNELRDAGAVASARAAEIYGLDILAERIQDDSDNITRYLVLARDPIIPSTNKPFKTSIVFTLEEGPGVLFKALATFALRDINLTKIESWPQRKHPLREVDNPNNGSAKCCNYLFYIDFEASMAEPRAQNALGHLQCHVT